MQTARHPLVLTTIRGDSVAKKKSVSKKRIGSAKAGSPKLRKRKAQSQEEIAPKLKVKDTTESDLNDRV